MRWGYFFFVAIAIFGGSLYGGFRIGTDLRKQELEKAVSVERRHHYLTDLRGCMYAMDSDTFRYILNPQTARLKRVLWRTAVCRHFIREASKDASDEKTSQAVGDALLFYDGYIATLKELLARQVELTILYEDFETGIPAPDTMSRIEALIGKQVDASEDTRKLLDKLEHLIVRAW